MHYWWLSILVGLWIKDVICDFLQNLQAIQRVLLNYRRFQQFRENKKLQNISKKKVIKKKNFKLNFWFCDSNKSNFSNWQFPDNNKRHKIFSDVRFIAQTLFKNGIKLRYISCSIPASSTRKRSFSLFLALSPFGQFQPLLLIMAKTDGKMSVLCCRTLEENYVSWWRLWKTKLMKLLCNVL